MSVIGCVIGEKNILKFFIGPGKLPGLSRNRPQAPVVQRVDQLYPADNIPPISLIRDPRIKTFASIWRFASVNHALLIWCYRNAALIFKKYGGHCVACSVDIRLQAVPFWIVERSREIASAKIKKRANERKGAWGEAEKRGKEKKVSSRLFLLAPVSLRYEHTISTNQKGTACSLGRHGCFLFFKFTLASGVFTRAGVEHRLMEATLTVFPLAY